MAWKVWNRIITRVVGRSCGEMFPLSRFLYVHVSLIFPGKTKTKSSRQTCRSKSKSKSGALSHVSSYHMYHTYHVHLYSSSRHKYCFCTLHFLGSNEVLLYQNCCTEVVVVLLCAIVSYMPSQVLYSVQLYLISIPRVHTYHVEMRIMYII